MADLIWEIGCEEIPATFVGPSLAQLEKLFIDKFTTAELLSQDMSTVQVFGTPRRLVLKATGLKARQEDIALRVKGPAVGVAFDAAGAPSRAAQGFANKNGIAPEALIVEDGYVYAEVTRAGQSTSAVASTLLPEIIRELTFPKAMRWGVSKMRFARPIRWILALLDGEVVPFNIEHIESGNKSRGHRFLSPEEFEVSSITDYEAKVRAASVLIDPEERSKSIVEQSKKLASEINAIPTINENLLDENVHLTEYPTAVLGSFDPAYLELPPIILVTSMRKHQRYFPVVDANGVLLPKFVAIRNGGDQYLDTVRAGFERVLGARFADAKFFFDLDITTSLEAKIEATKAIVFQEKLGSVYAKSLRLVDEIQTGPIFTGDLSTLKESALRAAALTKADLSSEMVKELPALQGEVGRYYALRDGETEEVATAIAEHYQPKGAGDPIPNSTLGRLLALIDRVDTLTGYMGIGILPTGTSDPYGLRRAASGVIALLQDDATLPSLRELYDSAWTAYAEQDAPFTQDPEPGFSNLLTLFNQRLENALEDQGIRYDIRAAVLGAGFVKIAEVFKTASALQQSLGSPELANAQAAAVRIGNILRFAAKEGLAIEGSPDPSHFADLTESALWDDFNTAKPSLDTAYAAGDFATGLSTLSSLRPAVDNFFNSVMIMEDNISIRNNRLALLGTLNTQYKRLADLEQLQS